MLADPALGGNAACEPFAARTRHAEISISAGVRMPTKTECSYAALDDHRGSFTGVRERYRYWPTALKFSGLCLLVSGFRPRVTNWPHVDRGSVMDPGSP
jgi:hypothetical protein